MNSSKSLLERYRELVSIRYQLYNSLFLTLPYEKLETVGNKLPLFAEHCANELEKGESPKNAVESFLNERFGSQDQDYSNKILFRILQLVERQVVLFDALEEASFEDTNEMNGAGTLEHFLGQVESSNKANELFEILDDYRIRIVLTAHPTQFYPEAVLGIITDLSKAIANNDVSAIRELLVQMGRTRFKNHEKPTPLKEAKSIIHYLKDIFYTVIPEIQDRVQQRFKEAPEIQPNALIELGFWPGGDRDGNPFVTHETTKDVAHELKVEVLKLYLNDLKTLKRRLTMNGVYERLLKVEHKLGDTLDTVNDGRPREVYNTAAELVAELNELGDFIIAKQSGLNLDYLYNFISKIQIFGFHFASMDLRQDSGMHETAISEIIAHFQKSAPENSPDLQGYDDLDEEKQLEMLTELLKVDMPAGLEQVEFPTDITAETLKSIQVAREIQQANGEKGLHRYIISNTQSAIDIFEPLVLAHLGGWKHEETNLDITPLFETIDDLANSEEIMDGLYQNPLYKAHLIRRGMRQNIMLGFSDGTKDGGYLTANWSIYKAKKALTAVSRKYGVHVTFFDGRGGPPARGGGNTHKFYRSLGPQIEHNHIHLTIQGQTISSNFGHLSAARYNMEQMFTSGLESLLFHGNKDDLTAQQEALIDDLSAVSKQMYIDFKSDENFTSYLEEMTPLNYYGRLNIGSRPAKRKSAAKLSLSDLRAIPFVGSWSQIKQNVPGFYGLGSAIESLLNTREEDIKSMYASSMFFRTLIENAAQALSKTYFPLTQYLSQDPQYGEFWKNIHNEAEKTVGILRQITGQKELLGESPRIKESIALREKIILPLLAIQQYALDSVRRHDIGEVVLDEEQVETYRKMVVKSLAANINASRNSA